MDSKNLLSEELHSLGYGMAITTFGQDAIQAVINDKRWIRKYPHVISGIEAKNYLARLPAEIVYEIAGREECTFDFFATPDGTRLYAKDRHKKWDEPRAIEIEIETKGYRHIPNQQALLDYGAYSLFRATDGVYGVKDETERAS